MDVIRALASARVVVVVRTDAIGDNVMGSALLAPLRKAAPGARIVYVCQDRAAELFGRNPLVNETVPFSRGRACVDEEYREHLQERLAALEADIALNPMVTREALSDELVAATGAPLRIGFSRSAGVNDTERTFTHTVTPMHSSGPVAVSEFEQLAVFCRQLGSSETAETLAGGVASQQGASWLSAEDHAFADAMLREEKIDAHRVLVLFAGAGAEYRQNAHLGQALAAAFADGSVSVISVGAAPEFELHARCHANFPGKHLNLCGRTTLAQTAAIVRRARLAVGTETGTAQIACALGTPQVVVIGGGHFGRFLPWPGALAGLTTLVTLPLGCFGCDWKCHHARAHCVQDVSAEAIALAIREAWSDPRRAALKPARMVFQNAGPLPHLQSPKIDPAAWFSRGVEILQVPAAIDARSRAQAAPPPRHERCLSAGRPGIRHLTGNDGAAWNRSIVLAAEKYTARGPFEQWPAVLELLDKRDDWALALAAPELGAGEIQSAHAAELFAQDLAGTAAIWRRSLHGEWGYFDASLNEAADYEFYLRIARRVPVLRFGLGVPLRNPGPHVHAGHCGGQRAYELHLARERYWQAAWGAGPREQKITRAFTCLAAVVRDRLPRGSRVALFGAGQHTNGCWQRFRGALEPHVSIAAVLDDWPKQSAIGQVPVLSTSSWRRLHLAAIIVSSDTYERKLWRRAVALVEKEIPVFAVYQADLRGGADIANPLQEQQVGSLKLETPDER